MVFGPLNPPELGDLGGQNDSGSPKFEGEGA
jgi:hypothetical protein